MGYEQQEKNISYQNDRHIGCRMGIKQYSVKRSGQSSVKGDFARETMGFIPDTFVTQCPCIFDANHIIKSNSGIQVPDDHYEYHRNDETNLLPVEGYSNLLRYVG